MNDSELEIIRQISNSGTVASDPAKAILSLLNGEYVHPEIERTNLQSTYTKTGLNYEDKIKMIPEIHVYPNPTNSIFTIRFQPKEQKHKIILQIVDITGKIAIENSIANASDQVTFDSSNLQNGIYFILLVNNGMVSSSTKLVVNH
jgi:hypothetical protein